MLTSDEFWKKLRLLLFRSVGGDIIHAKHRVGEIRKSQRWTGLSKLFHDDCGLSGPKTGPAVFRIGSDAKKPQVRPSS